MKELLDKLSSYNLFNYLLPGTVFVAAAQRTSIHRFDADNIVVELFLYYFIGLVISRLGSLFIEPLFNATKFVSFASYRDFVHGCVKDSKIELLSEQNNTYRTLCAVFVALGTLRLYDFVAAYRPRTARGTLLVVLFGLFAFAYRKQTNYIKQRVEVATE